jgi:hypothetical protein
MPMLTNPEARRRRRMYMSIDYVGKIFPTSNILSMI